jgi:hypothetical protein
MVVEGLARASSVSTLPRARLEKCGAYSGAEGLASNNAASAIQC